MCFDNDLRKPKLERAIPSRITLVPPSGTTALLDAKENIVAPLFTALKNQLPVVGA
jgi:hypothetical protein